MAILNSLQIEYDAAVRDIGRPTAMIVAFRVEYLTNRVQLHVQRVLDIILSSNYTPDATLLSQVFEYLDYCLRQIIYFDHPYANSHGVVSMTARLNNLSSAALASTSPSFINDLPGSIFSGLTSSFFNSLDLLNMRNLNSARKNHVISKFTSDRYNNLTDEQMVIFNQTFDYFPLMTAATISGLNANFFNRITIGATNNWVIGLNYPFLSNITNPAVIAGLNVSFLNAIHSSVIVQFPVTFFSNFSLSAIRGLTADFVNSLANASPENPTKITGGLSASFYNALSVETLRGLSAYAIQTSLDTYRGWNASVFNNLSAQAIDSGLGDYVLRSAVSETMIPNLSVNFFNALRNTTVNALIANTTYRPGERSFISYIPKDKWLHLDGVKYSTLIQGLTVAELNAFAGNPTVMNGIRLDALNALLPATISALSADFINHISNTLIQEIGNDPVAGGRFLNALSRDANSTVGNVVAQLDVNKWINAQNGFPIKAAVWSALDAGFFNAMSPATVASCMGYGAINCIFDSKIPSLSVEFLNAINAGSVELMINTPSSLRASNFADQIPRSKWLLLDGTKYSALIQRLTVVELNAFASNTTVMNGIRLDALNALLPATISALSVEFVNHLPNTLIQAIGNDPVAGGRFLNALSRDANSTVGNVVSQLDVNKWINAQNGFPIKAAVWSALDAGFFNAMSSVTVASCMGYGAINCIFDYKIPSLSIDFLNAINAGSVDMMINTPSSWRASNFADQIPKSTWLLLDGTKYGGLIQRLTAAELNAFAGNTTVMNGIRLDALNALLPATISALNVDFVNHIPNTLIQAIGNDPVAGGRFLNALSRDANSTVGNVVAQLDVNKWVNAQNGFPIKAAVWSALDAGFFNAMSPVTVASCMGYGAINCIFDSKIPGLSIDFLNAINPGSVGLMINTPSSWRASNFADQIPKSKWLSLDGTKYSALIQRLTVADVDVLMSVDVNEIRSDALNALPAFVVRILSINFLISLTSSNRIIPGMEFANFFNNLTATQISEYVAADPQRIFRPLSQMNWMVVSRLNKDFFNNLTGSQMFWINAPFLNCVNVDVLRTMDQSVRNGISWGLISQLSEDRRNIIYTAGYCNNLSASVISSLGFENFVNYIADENIANLNVNFLNALPNATINLMINTPLSLRTSNFVNQISKSKWLMLDGVKYSALLAGATVADVPALIGADVASIRSDALNSLAAVVVAAMPASFLNTVVSVSGLLSNLSSRFFNYISVSAFLGISSDLLKYIGKRIHDEQSITSTSTIKLVLSTEQIRAIQNDKITDLLNEWMSESPIVNFIPASILNNMTVDQVESMSGSFSAHIADNYFRGNVSQDVIVGLAKKSTASSLAISNTQLANLSDSGINLFLGVYLNKSMTTVAAPINVLNALTPHQVTVLDPAMLKFVMPISDIRSGLLSATFVANISADGFSSLSEDALSALSVAINNNPTKYKFNGSQLRSLDAYGLTALLSAYKGAGQTYTGYIPHNILNNLSSEQIKRIDRGIVNHCITDLTNEDLAINVLTSLGNLVYTYSRIAPNDVLSAMPATSEFQKLIGERLVAFLKAWNMPVGGNYVNIPPAILEILSTAQMATLPIGVIKHSVAAIALSASQLNALSTSVINQLDVAWLNAIPNSVVAQLGSIFLSAIPKDVFKLLSSDFVGNINSSLMGEISPDTIKAIAGQYIGKRTAFNTNQVSNFSADQLEALFMGSASNDSGDYQFADLSNVLTNISLPLEDEPAPDDLANVPLYILLGTIQNESERQRLIINRYNLNTEIIDAQNDYKNGNTSDKLERISFIRSLLLRASDNDLMLLSLDTINRLSSLNSANASNWETTGRLTPEESSNEIAESIKSILLKKFSVLSKSIVSGVNDAIITAVGEKLKADLAAGTISTVISDAQFRALPNHQLGVLLSQWTTENVAIPRALLEKISVTQIGDLTPATLTMIANTADLAHAPDSFLVGLGYIAQELNTFNDHMKDLGWWTGGESPRRTFDAVLSASQLQSLSTSQLALFLSPWIDNPRVIPVSAYILKMLSDTQLAGLDDAIYENLTATEVNAILPRIPATKINLLNPSSFAHDVDDLVGKAWPTDAQLAVMSADQVNVLLSMWRENVFYSSSLRLTGTNKLMAINDGSFSLLGNNGTWYYRVNTSTHLLEKKTLSDSTLISPADELFRKTLMALSAATRENVFVDHANSLILFNPENSNLGSYVTTISFDENNLDIIHSLPLGMISFLNDDVIDLIAAEDELLLAINENMFFSKIEFSMLTDAQVTRYISAYLDAQINSTNNLPLPLLNTLSYRQVKNLTDAQFSAIPADVISFLSDEFIMGLTEAQLRSWISSGKLKQLRLDQIPFIDVNVIANFGTRLSNFTSDQLANLRSDQIRALGTVIPRDEVDALRRPYLNTAALEAFVDSNLVPDQYAFLNKEMFAHLTQAQRQQISPSLMPYISSDVITQLAIDGNFNQLTNAQIWNLSNAQINAAFPSGVTRSSPLRVSTQLGLLIEQVLGSSLDQFNMAQANLTTLTSIDIAALPPEALAEFSTAELGLLTDAQIFNLTLDQINALGQKKYAALAKTPGPVLALTAAQIGTLSATQINALTAQTIGDFSVTQFKALLHNTVVPFITIDPALLQFVDASVLNALNSRELDMWSQDQIAALSINALYALSDYNKSIVRSIMGISDNADDVSAGRRSLQMVNVDSVYSRFDSSPVPTRAPAKLTNPAINNTSFVWDTNRINALHTNAGRTDYYVSAADLAKTYLLPYRDVTTIRYILLDNLYSSSKYDIQAGDGSTLSRFSSATNNNAARILQARKYLQFGRLFGSVLLMVGAPAMFENAWNLRDVRPARETAADFLTGIGWIASGLQVPWGMAFNAIATKDYGGARVSGSWNIVTPLAAYFGINRPFNLQGFAAVAPAPSAAPPSAVAASGVVAAGAGAGIVVDPSLSNEQIFANAQQRIQTLSAEKTTLWESARANSIQAGTIKEELQSLLQQIRDVDSTKGSLKQELAGVGRRSGLSALEKVNERARINAQLTQLKSQRASLASTFQTKQASLGTARNAGASALNKVRAIQLRVDALNRISARADALINVRPATLVPAASVPTSPAASRTILGLTFDKKLKWQGMNKGGWVFALANLMGAVNGLMGIINGSYDVDGAGNNAQARADGAMRIFTGMLSFAGGVSLFIGDNIDALADAGPRQQFLGARFTNIALLLGYASQGINTVYREWALYSRGQNGWQSALWSTASVVIRLGLLAASWAARTNFWGSIITSVAMTVVPFLIGTTTEFLLSQNYLDNLKNTLTGQGRTAEVDLWIPVLKNIENHASLFQQVDIVTYKQSQLNELSAQMLATHAANLKLVLEQQKQAEMMYTVEGLGFLNDSINAMVSSIGSTTSATTSDFYLIEMRKDSKKNYYVMQTGERDTKFSYLLQSHLSINSLRGTATKLSANPNFANADDASKYFAVNAFVGNDLDAEQGGVIVLNNQKTNAQDTSVAVIQLLFSQDYYDLTQTNLVIDARQASKNMVFDLDSHTTVWAGTGANTFNVDQEKVTDASYTIVATDFTKNELNLSGNITRSINFNLDNFDDVRVVQHSVNYDFGNTATGTHSGQYYVANFGGKNTINMSGGGSYVVANGRGNNVNLSGDDNTVYVQLLSDVLQNSAYQAMSVGTFNAETDLNKVGQVFSNKLNFSLVELFGKEKFVVDVNGRNAVAAIKNAGVVVDAVNFSHFQQLEGSANGSTINMTGDTGISALILNDAIASGGVNNVNLQDVSGLGIVSSGSGVININESNPENNTLASHTNYVYMQGAGGGVINAYANTITGARLESANDTINFEKGARFNLLEVGSGTHTIKFAMHNGSQIDSGVNGLIRMTDSNNSNTTVIDDATRDVVEDCLIMQLTDNSYADDYRIAYFYNTLSKQNEIYIQSSGGARSLTYMTVNTDINNNSYAEIVVRGASNSVGANTYYESDINVIIEAIAELNILHTQAMVSFSGYVGYGLDVILEKVQELNNFVYLEKESSYTLLVGENNLRLYESYDTNGNIIRSINGTGNAQGNRIIGTDGDNILDGAAGADVLIGGYGNDIYIVDNIGDVVVEYGDQGTDTVQASINYTLTDNVENLTLTGSGNINATGNSGNNALTGNTGNNTLAGGTGNDTLFGTSGSDIDTLIGGVGDDTYVVNALDKNVVVEGAQEGIDTIQTTLASFLLSNGNHQYDNIENLVYTGTATFSGTGNSLDNIFSASTLSSTVRRTFDGGAGNDTINYNNATAAVNVTINATSGSATGAVNDVLMNIENVIGGLGNDTLSGDGLANILVGGSGDDSIMGGGGNDTIDAGVGNNTIDGDAGVDTLDYSRASDSIIVSLAVTTAQATIGAGTDVISNMENILGSVYDDFLTGDANQNVLNGADGDDILGGGDGNDNLIGGNGFDMADYSDATQGVSVNLAVTTLQNTRGAGWDVLNSIEGLSGGDFNDTLVGDSLNNLLNGGVGDDSLVGDAGNDTLDGGVGVNILVGGAGNDVYIINNASDVVREVANFDIDTVQTNLLTTLDLTAYQNVENIIYTGTNNFVGKGSAANNTLLGNVGNDSLDGGSGVDTMKGGAGNDTYIVDDSNDVVVESANGGVDTIKTTLSTFTLGYFDEVENITYIGTAAAYLVGNTLDNVLVGTNITSANGNDTYDGSFGSDTVSYNNITAAMTINLATKSARGAGIDTLVSIENAIGGSGNDTITGSDVDNILDGASGNNSLLGGDGNDTLESGIGNNILDGGAGSDTVSYRNSTTAVVVSLVAKIGNDTIVDVENLIGSDLSDTLIGNNQDNILEGGASGDILTGGSGNDTYIIDSTADQINEDSIAGAGIDTVKIKDSFNVFTLGINLENLIYMGTAGFAGTGNAVNNVLSGNNGSDTLSGLDGDDSLMAYAGNDLLSGGIGNDTLDGGVGSDTLDGGDGNDVYIVDSTGDVVVEATTASTGTDLVKTMLSSLTLAQNVENLTYTGVGTFSGKGNQLANIIMGGVHADTLDGGAGADTLIGGLGDDTYVIDTTADVIVEATSEGIDTIVSSILLTLNLSTYANVENINYTGTSAFSGTGNSVNNIFWGGIGNDTFDGAAGSDTMSYSKANKSVTVVLGLAGANGSGTGLDVGTDTLINIENIIGGSGRDAITGNDVNNVLSAGAGSDTVSGGAGNDTLDGGTGEDSLVGGVGDDVYIIDSANDILVEDSAANGGVDTIASSSLYTVDLRNYSNIENLRFTGVGDFLGIGDTANNVLSSGAGDDTLDGASGADTIIGGNGNDTYYIDSTGDAVIESSASGAGQDLVITNLSALTLFANVEDLIFTGTANFNGTGNSGNNLLISASGNDTLSGSTGSDTLSGGAGNDTYNFARGDGIDRITEDDATTGNSDTLNFTNSITKDQLWFTQVNNDLEVSVIGTMDKVTLANWYLGDQYKIETIKDSGSLALTASAVASLVTAMAQVAPPVSGTTTMPSGSTYTAVIAAINTAWR